MSQSLLLGIDIGTYESKGVLTTLDGKVVSHTSVPHDLILPRAGWVEHDAEKTWWGDFCLISNKLIKASQITGDQIKAVGVSAIGPDVLPIDRELRPLRNGILYGVDTRAYQEIDELNSKYGENLIYENTSNCLSSQSVGPKILWIKKNEPEIFRKTRWFVHASTFIVAKLTGEVVTDHLSAGCSVPLYDPRTFNWSDKFSSEYVTIDQLPKIRWSSEIAGYVTKSAGELSGLMPGTPVAVGTIDAAAEALSVGVTIPGDMMMMYGSTIFMIQVTDNNLARDKRLWASPYLFQNTWCLLAGMSTSGSLTRWFRDNFAKDLIALEKNGSESAYAQLVKEASTVSPGSEGLIVLPYFSGERTPIMDPKAKGMFFGMNLTHTRAHLFRAILEGMAYGVKQHVELFTSIGAKPKVIKSVGGGTKNDIWLQAISDVSGIPQELAPFTFGASYGDAFLAGISIGLVKDPETIKEWQGKSKIIKANPKLEDIYAPMYKIYSSLYEDTKKYMHKLHELEN